MYLKSLDMTGFKSFPDRTRLEFTPGMTAIVGPNGCGKSNVADAVRWVLGEQSPKALRGRKMEDCIFTGTDARKALNMAEVSITFAECEGVLSTEYDEVTVTRRVFRSGEGQYLLNKTPCRLKDIHRLFMGTGIGTSSYSMLEQGRIDQILSSHPEDRREVFEEASGITKFKSDKKESLRKLEQTDQNLLRLQDVLREVKRQIGSLQRQAGKARRYKELREQLRGLDVFATRARLQGMDEDIRGQAAALQALGEKLQALHAELAGIETGERDLQTRLADSDRRIENGLQLCGERRAGLEQTRALIRTNDERILEIQALAERDSGDMTQAREQAARLRESVAALVAEISQADTDKAREEQRLQEKQADLAELEARAEAARQENQTLRTESLDLENRAAEFQNALMQLETREHANVLRHERLNVEHTQLERAVESFREREERLHAERDHFRGESARRQEALNLLAGNRAETAKRVDALRNTLAQKRTALASRQAQIELLAAREAAGNDFPAGARLILDEDNPLALNRDKLVGSLAAQIDAAPDFRPALQAVLRAWADAVVVADAPTALAILDRLRGKPDGAARLLCATIPPREPRPVRPVPPGCAPLAAQVRCPEHLRPLMDRLLENVLVWTGSGHPAEPVAEGFTLVTGDGALMRDGWMFEFWKPDTAGADPIARKLLTAQLQEERDVLAAEIKTQEETLATLGAEGASIEEAVIQARQAFDEARRGLAQKEGESQIVGQEAAQARKRLETVSWELTELRRQTSGAGAEQQALAEKLAAVADRRTQVRDSLETVSGQWQELEKARATLQEAVSEQRVAFSEIRQHADHLRSRQEPLQARIAELESLARGRAEGLSAHEAALARLRTARQEGEARIPELEKAAEQAAADLEQHRAARQEQAAALRALEERIALHRKAEDGLREERSHAEVKLAESRLFRENLVQRVTSEYGMTLDEVWRAPEPKWPDDARPEPAALDAQIAELRGRIEAMGPVNLIAIEEYQELEERLAFLTRQHDDLVTSKEQLLEAIRKINETTSAMFAETFARINANFDATFKELFNGGTARLEMLPGEDVLESGIEIIARPPGKRLQSISLLSGGERTMTAVALLFAIYMIRPSPFCMLDELDAALDESNINRFVKMLRGFLEQSQFIVITHNRRTIAAASVLYGVTMQERGISRIVSIKFEDYEAGKLPPTNGTPAAETSST